MDRHTFITRRKLLQRKASRRFEREFGYGLRDPFDDICRMLSHGTAFSFSRFGDGEFNAIFGVEGANCDGHRYFSDLGQRLREIVESEPSYIMGLQPLAILIHRAERIHLVSRDLRWVFAGALHSASLEGRLEAFFDALAGRDTVLVGAPHHRRLATARSWRFVEVAYGDCWPQYESLRALLEPAAASNGTVFLFCASMTTNVLIDDLYRLNPRNTYIDVGSAFDPYVGVVSRTYHEVLNPIPSLETRSQA